MESDGRLKKLGTLSKGRVPWNKGKKWSIEVRQKISRTLKGKPGRKHNPETIKKMSLLKKEWWRKQHERKVSN